jgi:serine/threonine-protein kinase
LAEIGTVLNGRYELLEPIGDGGMATIWRARDRRLGRDVAVKLMRPEYGRDPDFVVRFRQEAQSAASLAHPTSWGLRLWHESRPVHRHGTRRGQDPAHPARPRRSAGSRLGTYRHADRRRLAAACVQGHKMRHQASTVLITVSGRSCGRLRIARALSEAQLTLPGQTLGTPRYMSPEQARGENVTPAADIYSLGLVLFEMVTGRAAWGGDTAAAVAMVRLTEEPPVPSSHRSDVPPAMDAIVRKALQRDPTQRFGSAGAFSDALGRFLSGLHAGVAAPVVSAPASAGADQSPTVVGAAAPPSLGVGSGRPPQARRDAAADEADGGRGPGAWAWAAALLGVAVLVAAGALIYVFLNAGGGGGATPKPSGALVEVPRVIDLPVAEAKAAIEGGRAGDGHHQQRPDQTRPSNTVVARIPPRARARGSDVNVTIAIGPAPCRARRGRQDGGRGDHHLLRES